MSVVLLVSMTIIACNMDKVATVEMEKENKNVKTKNGKVVVIDPGHGGDDPGKVGVNGTKEKDVNLAISKCLKEVLEDNGFDVVMTRNKDEILNEGGKFSKVGDLNKRCSIINNTYQINSNSIMISIHQNSFTNPNVKGAQSFFYEKSEKSKKLGLILQNHLNKKINTEKEKAAKPNNSYYMLINSKCPGTIIECGFLSNPSEEESLSKEEYQKKLAEIICTGIKEYFGEDKVLNIITFSKISSKTAIQKACKGLDINNDIAGYLKSLIPVDRGKVAKLKDCLFGNKEKGIKPVYELVSEMKKYPNANFPIGKYYMSTYRHALKQYIKFLDDITSSSL